MTDAIRICESVPGNSQATEVRRDSRLFDARESRARRASCMVLVRKGLWSGHWDLRDPDVQTLIKKDLLAFLTAGESLDCPFPSTHERCNMCLDKAGVQLRCLACGELITDIMCAVDQMVGFTHEGECDKEWGESLQAAVTLPEGTLVTE